MAHTTIEQFATELKMPAGALLEQLAAAASRGKKQGDKPHRAGQDAAARLPAQAARRRRERKKKITLTRKQTTEIKAAGLDRQGAHDPGRSAQEARACVARRGSPSRRRARRGSAEAAHAAAMLPPEELAAREAEDAQGAGVDARASRKTCRRSRLQVVKRKTKKEREAEEAAATRGCRSRRPPKRRKPPPKRLPPRPREAGRGASREGTLHRPAAKPGEKREKPAKKAPGAGVPGRGRAAARAQAARRYVAAAPAPPAGAVRRRAAMAATTRRATRRRQRRASGADGARDLRARDDHRRRSRAQDVGEGRRSHQGDDEARHDGDHQPGASTRKRR